MLAINPATPIYSVEEVLEYVAGITVLAVDPGYAGQQTVRSCMEKTKKLSSFLAEIGFQELNIEVDGDISFENTKILRALGANIFVAGTSSIFPRSGAVQAEKISLMRDAIT